MPKPKPTKVAAEHVEVIARFSRLTFSYFISQSFDEVVRKVVRQGFGTETTVKPFEPEVKETLDRDRESH